MTKEVPSVKDESRKFATQGRFLSISAAKTLHYRILNRARAGLKTTELHRFVASALGDTP
jgi:hypothetical protein